MATVLLDTRPEKKFSLDKSFSRLAAHTDCTRAVAQPSTDLGYRSLSHAR
jgi:hypothetical protein